MDWNFPTIAKVIDFFCFALSAIPPLVLIQERGHITCVICQKKFLRVSIKALFRVSSEEGLKAALTALKKLCQEKGFANLWKGKLKICLNGDDALFLDFHLPPSSRQKLKKTIPLILDEELPLQAGSYITKTFLTREQGYYAIATVLQKQLLEQWHDCLQEFEFKEASITVFPWPVLKSLPPLKVSTLLICLSSGGNVFCALNPKGEPIRIQQLRNDGGNVSNIARQIKLLLSDINFEPKKILFFGGYEAANLKKAIMDEYDLPGKILGSDLPLGGAYERIDENDSTRILAQTINYERLFSISASPLVTYKFKREKSEIFPWMLPIALTLTLLCGFEIFSLYNSMNKLSKADHIKSLLVEHLRKDLDNIPKNSSLGRLTAILNSRLAEMENKDARGGQFVSLLEDIHKATPFEARIGLNRLAYDTKHIRMQGNANTYEEVNILKNSIEKIEDIEIVRIMNATANQGSGKDRQQIVFELDLVLK